MHVESRFCRIYGANLTMRAAALLLAVVLISSGCGNTASATSSAAAASASPAGVPGSNPAPDPSGNWVMPARDYASTRFSPLDQITPQNAKQLVVKGTFSTG